MDILTDFYRGLGIIICFLATYEPKQNILYLLQRTQGIYNAYQTHENEATEHCRESRKGFSGGLVMTSHDMSSQQGMGAGAHLNGESCIDRLLLTGTIERYPLVASVE